MRDVLHMRVSLAVLLIDDFTGRIITSSDAQVSVEGGRKPVVKREGFRVFTNLTEPEVRVRAGGPCYCEEEQAVDLRQLDRSLPVVRLRLRPNRWYPLPAGTARVSVQLPEDTQLLAYCQESGGFKPYRGVEKKLRQRIFDRKQKNGRAAFLLSLAISREERF